VVALGNFDGLHLGHRALIGETVRLAKSMGLISCVWSFETHPVLENLRGPRLILDPQRRLELLEELGIELYVTDRFEDVRDLSPEAFAEEIIARRLNARAAVCGFNYSFGKNASGDPQTLKALLEPKGISVEIVSPIKDENGETVSSSLVRRLIENGEMSRAVRLLGSPYEIRSAVVRGKGLGRELGFATANQILPSDRAVPRKGVYASRMDIDGKVYDAVSNVGVRPTVENGAGVNLETHVFGYSGDLYGKTVTAGLYEFIRDERKFSGVDELSQQIKRDSENVREYFRKI